MAYVQTEDVWDTSLTGYLDDLAVTVSDDTWMDSLDEAEHEELQYLRETPQYGSNQQDELPDSVFDELLVDHAQWMRELEEEADSSGFDGLATSYDMCVW